MKQHEATTMTIQQSNKELALTCINNLFVGFGTNQERTSMGWTSGIVNVVRGISSQGGCLAMGRILFQLRLLGRDHVEGAAPADVSGCFWPMDDSFMYQGFCFDSQRYFAWPRINLFPCLSL